MLRSNFRSFRSAYLLAVNLRSFGSTSISPPGRSAAVQFVARFILNHSVHVSYRLRISLHSRDHGFRNRCRYVNTINCKGSPHQCSARSPFCSYLCRSTCCRRQAWPSAAAVTSQRKIDSCRSFIRELLGSQCHRMWSFLRRLEQEARRSALLREVG